MILDQERQAEFAASAEMPTAPATGGSPDKLPQSPSDTPKEPDQLPAYSCMGVCSFENEAESTRSVMDFVLDQLRKA